jgi:hypothetical protein
MTGKNSCIPYHRVVRITEGVSATANEMSEEEKLRKLCGYSVNAVRLPGNNLKESPPQRTQRARRKNSRLEA